MNLPIKEQNYKFIKVKLPSSKTIGVRGWKIKDEKELIFALDSEENIEEHKIDHIVSFLRNCVDDARTFDSLSEVDLKKIASEIRKLSKGTQIEYSYSCPFCEFKMYDNLDITKAEEIKEFSVAPIKLSDELTVTFKDLPYSVTNKLFEEYKNSQSKFDYYCLLHSIDSVTIGNDTYTDLNVDNLEEFLGNEESKILETLYSSYDKVLSDFSFKRKVNCKKCKKEINVSFGDLFSFLVF